MSVDSVCAASDSCTAFSGVHPGLRGVLLQSRWHLACTAGPDVGGAIALSGVRGQVTVGRIHQVVTDPQVSREHLLVRWTPQGVQVRDAASANGSRVVRVGVVGRRSCALPGGRWVGLRVGDEVCVGQSRWQLRARPRRFSFDSAPPSAGDGLRRFFGGDQSAGASIHRATRWLAVAMSVVFVPLSLGRLLGISAWWPLGVMGVIIGVSVFRVFFRRRQNACWDGARVLVALDRGAPHVSPRQWGQVPLSEHSPAGSCVARSACGPVPELDFSARGGQPLPSVGFYGPRAILHALWAMAVHSLPYGGAELFTPRGVFTLGMGGPPIHLLECPVSAPLSQENPACPFSELSPCDQAVHCVVSEDLALLPSWCSDIGDCDAPAPVSATWAALLMRPSQASSAAKSALPRSVLMEELWAGSLVPQETRALPQSGPRTLRAPVGVDEAGAVVSIDLIADGPHGVIVGTTGSGKSEALISLLCSLARAYSPADVRIVAIDYKGGASLGPLAKLPHVQALLTDLSPQLTQRAFEGLRYVVRQREALLAGSGFSSLSAWEAADRDSAPARIVIACDEFATFAEVHPELFQDALRLAAQGRALGVHVIFATQRPDRALNTALLANIDFRVALRCREVSASQALVGSNAAAELPQIPGRAILDGRGLFQAGWIPDVGAAVDQIVRLWREVAVTPLWTPDLPASLVASDVRGGCGRPGAALASGAGASAALGADHCHFALADGIAVGAHFPLAWLGGHCRFESGLASRQEVWRAVCASAVACALGTGRSLIVCSQDRPEGLGLPFRWISSVDVAELVAVAAGVDHWPLVADESAGCTAGRIVVIEDGDHVQRLLVQAVGQAHGQALWSRWLSSAEREATALFVASNGVHTVWDREGSHFAYRLVKVVSQADVQARGLPSSLQPDGGVGRFYLLTAPPAALCVGSGGAPVLPHVVRVCDVAGGVSGVRLEAGREGVRLPSAGVWRSGDGREFVPAPGSVVIGAGEVAERARRAWQGGEDAGEVVFVEPGDWMKIPSLFGSSNEGGDIVILTLTEDVRRAVLPCAHRCDWLLRLKNLADNYALCVRDGGVFLLEKPQD